MAVVNKSYLDYQGLQTYDGKIKEEIADVEDQIPNISVDTVNEKLIISFSNAAAAQGDSESE